MEYEEEHIDIEEFDPEIEGREEFEEDIDEEDYENMAKKKKPKKVVNRKKKNKDEFEFKTPTPKKGFATDNGDYVYERSKGRSEQYNISPNNILISKRRSIDSEESYTPTPLSQEVLKSNFSPLKTKRRRSATPKKKITPLKSIRKDIERTKDYDSNMRRKLSLKFDSSFNENDEDDDEFEKAIHKLHVSSLPKNLPCREKEREEIMSYLSKSIVERTSGSIYISGRKKKKF